MKRLALALVLAAGVADANVWQHAVDRDAEVNNDVYEAAMAKGDEAARQAATSGASSVAVRKLVDNAVAAYTTAANAKPAEGEPWWRIATVVHRFYFDCEVHPLLPTPSPLCSQRLDSKRAEQVISAWDRFEQLAPLDSRLTISEVDDDRLLFERAILHTKLLETSDPQASKRHLEAAARDYEQTLARLETGAIGTSLYEQSIGNLAETYMMLDRLDEAVDTYREAVQHGGHDSTVYGYAVALDRNDDGDVARDEILRQGEAGAQRFHNEVEVDRTAFFVPAGEVYYYYGLIAETLGHNEDAIEYWQLYIRSGAHPEYQPRAKQHLDALLAKRVKRAVPHLDWGIDL